MKREFRPRAHERVRHLRDVVVRAGTERRCLWGHTIDLSQGGVRLFVNQSLSPGDTVELTWVDRDLPVTLNGRVIYAISEYEGVFVGVKFDQSLAIPALRELMRRPEQPRRIGEASGIDSRWDGPARIA